MFLRVQWPSKPQLKVNYKPGKVLAGNKSRKFRNQPSSKYVLSKSFSN